MIDQIFKRFTVEQYIKYWIFEREKRGISFPGDLLQLQLECLQFSPDLPQLRDLQGLVRLTLLAVTGGEGALIQNCNVLVFSIKITSPSCLPDAMVVEELFQIFWVCSILWVPIVDFSMGLLLEHSEIKVTALEASIYTCQVFLSSISFIFPAIWKLPV